MVPDIETQLHTAYLFNLVELEKKKFEGGGKTMFLLRNFQITSLNSICTNVCMTTETPISNTWTIIISVSQKKGQQKHYIYKWFFFLSFF